MLEHMTKLLEVGNHAISIMSLILSRHTELNADQKLFVKQLKLELPPQPPPRITAAGQIIRAPALAPL
jgi:hypothetical protein